MYKMYVRNFINNTSARCEIKKIYIYCCEPMCACEGIHLVVDCEEKQGQEM